jgi:hypothetical protein
MLTKPTVFVIGAGASAEFDLPIGSELQRNISAALDVRLKSDNAAARGDFELRNLIRQLPGFERPTHDNIQHQIAESMSLTNSIDAYLENYRSNPLFSAIGKLSIAKAILQAERSSTLQNALTDKRSSGQIQLPENNWANRVFKFLQQGRPREQVDDFFSNCSFVVFNYDRVLETYFSEALQIYYGISQQQADKIVGRAEILHPYGKVGAIRSQQEEEIVLDFGAENADLIRVSQGIRIYSEPQDANETVPAIKQLITNAQIICFLGFSFQPQNMEILFPEPVISFEEDLTILASAYQFSQFNRSKLIEILSEEFSVPLKDIHIGGKAEKCAPFLDDYAMAFR